MRFRSFVLGIAATFLCFAFSWAQDDNPVERVFYNAKIFTAEPLHPFAEAIAIRGDKIMAVGSRAEVTRAVGSNAESIALRGRSLLPGLIDSHIHAIYGGLKLNSADVGDKVQSLADLAAFAAEAKRSGKGMRGDVLMISGIPLSFWSKTDELNAQFGSGAYDNLPVFLWGSDGHTGWANNALRLRAGLTKDFISHLPEPDRKDYGLAADLEPNGRGAATLPTRTSFSRPLCGALPQ
jgi:predicted amidohydrolase YtcJ